jgi:integrase/recombinase XerD
LLLLEAAKSYEVDKSMEGFSPQTLNAYKLQARLLMDYTISEISKQWTLQLRILRDI